LTQEPTQAPRQTVAPRKPSKGESAFDWLIYGGIAGVGTFFLTIAMAYVVKYKGGDAWVAKQLQKAKIDPDGIAGTAINVTTLMHGGNILAVPVYFAEKNREDIVDKLNYALGDKTPKEEIEPKPKQTVLSVFTSRIVAWCAVFVGWVSAETAFPKSFKTFQDEVGRSFAKLMGSSQYRTGIPEAQEAVKQGLLAKEQGLLGKVAELDSGPMRGKELKHVMGLLQKELKGVQKELMPFETRRFRFGKLTSLDVFATAVAATLFFMGNNFFGNLFNGKKEGAPEPEQKKLKIPNPTLPRTEEAPQLERKTDFAQRLAEQKAQPHEQEAAHAR
jgi:hypothetical protein